MVIACFKEARMAIKIHCPIYQTINIPDRFLFAIYGPEAVRRHYMTLYHNSGWNLFLQQKFFINGLQYKIFGYNAYFLRPWIQRPYLITQPSSIKAIFNKNMSSVRVLVEHNYRDIKKIWTSQDFARNLKLRQAPIAIPYKFATIMKKIYMCLYESG